MECDIVLVAIGQDIVSQPFADFGLATNWGRIVANEGGAANMVGVYAGGDCVSGPSTVIKAIAAGKAAAANIDEYLGCHHPISCDVAIPEPIYEVVNVLFMLHKQIDWNSKLTRRCCLVSLFSFCVSCFKGIAISFGNNTISPLYELSKS